MMVQYILLALIVVLATGFVVRKIREPFRSKRDCGAACGKCQALDKLEEIKKAD